jgi:hypothetical protein
MEEQIKLLRRYNLYKELCLIEPRMWTKNHHLLHMLTNTFIFNFTIFGIYKIYYKLYDPEVGMIETLMRSNRFKIFIIGIITTNISLVYLNYIYLPKYVYEEYYSQLTNDEFYEMYHNLKLSYNLKNNYS